MDKSRYPTYVTGLLFAPVALAIIMASLANAGAIGAAFSWLIGLGIFASVIFAYIAQIKFLPETYRPRVKRQLIFIGAAFMLVAGGGSLGDILGRIEFNDWEDNDNILMNMVVGGFIGWVAVYVCAIGNAIFIATNGVNEFVKVIGTIIRTLCWIGIAVVSFGLYSLNYTLHDPSTE